MDDIKVSVLCTVYNHAEFLRACLDGFVMQKTNFKFEVIIHDDASTDGSADIIREYAAKYPDIFVPIYQTENQYSKGGGIAKRFMNHKVRGKYVAWCEGDDCWTHPEKLQRQVDFLDSHPDFTACVHCANWKYYATGKSFVFPQIKESREYTAEEVILNGGGHYANCSLMGRSALLLNIPEIFTVKGIGDYQKYIYSAISGRFWCMKEVMSQYNNGTPGSWNSRVWAHNNRRINTINNICTMLKRVDEYYDYKYTNAFTHVIRSNKVEIAVLSNDKSIFKNPEYKPFLKQYYISATKQKLYKSFPFLQGFISHFSFLKKLKQLIQG